MFPNRVPMDRDTSSPEPLVYLICICLPETPKIALLQNMEKNMSPSTEPHADRRGDMAWFPKGIVNDTAISTPVPCSLWHNTFHLGLGRPEPC